MNIAMVVYSHYSRDARVRRYAESLARIGFRVDVICLAENYEPREENISLIRYPLSRRRYGKFWYILEYGLFFIFTSFFLTVKFFSKRYKAIHINNMPDILVFAGILPKIFGSKLILDMHDPMPELYMSKYRESEESFGVHFLKWLEKVSLNFADQIITANDEFKKIFLRRNPLIEKKISVILNCPDPRIFKSLNKKQSATNNRNFTLLYMGTVEKRFGLDIAVESMPELVKRIRNIRLVIIPKLSEEGDYFTKLKDKIENMGLEDKIIIKSPLPLESIAGEISQADIGIVLAQNGIFTENIFPVKLLEFIQMGIPVIATKTKILNTNFRNDQIYFLKENNTKDYCSAVLNLQKNAPLRAKFAKNAKAYLQRYNWKKEERKYLKLINIIQ